MLLKNVFGRSCGTGVAWIGVIGTGVAWIGVIGTGVAGIRVIGTGVAWVGVIGTGVFCFLWQGENPTDVCIPT